MTQPRQTVIRVRPSSDERYPALYLERLEAGEDHPRAVEVPVDIVEEFERCRDALHDAERGVAEWVRDHLGRTRAEQLDLDDYLPEPTP